MDFTSGNTFIFNSHYANQQSLCCGASMKINGPLVVVPSEGVGQLGEDADGCLGTISCLPCPTFPSPKVLESLHRSWCLLTVNFILWWRAPCSHDEASFSRQEAGPRLPWAPCGYGSLCPMVVTASDPQTFLRCAWLHNHSLSLNSLGSTSHPFVHYSFYFCVLCVWNTSLVSIPWVPARPQASVLTAFGTRRHHRLGTQTQQHLQMLKSLT